MFAIAPVLLTAFLAMLGWLVNRMLKLSEAVATCVEKVNAINVEQNKLDDRVHTLIFSRMS